MTERDPIETMLRQPDRVVAPAAAFAGRLRRRIAAELAADVATKGESPMLAHPHPPPVPLPTPVRSAGPRRPPHPWLRAVEMAAVLVLMVGAVGGYLGAGRFWAGQPGGAPAGSPTDAADEPAAMWGGDAARSGTQPGPGPRGEVEIRWQLVAEENAGYGSPPVALDGRFYRTGFKKDPSTSALLATYLEALDVESGKRLWRASLDNFGAPAVTAEMVYVRVLAEGWSDGPNPGTSPSALVALDAASGREVWRASTGSTTGGSGVPTSPIVNAGTVYVADPDGTVYARDAVTGTERWTSTDTRPKERTRGSGLPPHGATGTLAVGNGAVYVGNPRGVLFALDAVAGDVRWSVDVLERFRMRSGRIMPIAVAGAVLVEIAGTEEWYGDPEFPNMVAAIDAGAGSSLWDRRFSELGGDVAVAEGLVLVPIVGDGRSAVVAIDLKSGETRWEQELSGGGFLVPSVADGIVYAGTGDGSLYAVDVDSGEERWRLTPTAIFARYPPAVADGAVFAVDDAGTVSALAAPGDAATPTTPKREPA